MRGLFCPGEDLLGPLANGWCDGDIQYQSYERWGEAQQSYGKRRWASVGQHCAKVC